MRNMKVATKLITGFSIMLIMALAIGLFGIFGMYNMNVGDDRLYNGNYLPSILAGNISQLIIEQRVHIRSYIIYEGSDPAFAKAYADMTETQKSMNSLMKEYDGTIVKKEDRDAFNEFSKVYQNDWLPLLERIHQYGVAGNNAMARSELLSDVAVTTAAKLNDLTTQLQEINMEDGQDTVDANSDLFVSMTILGIVILVAATIVAVWLALYIARLIRRPLLTLTTFMNRAATTGDITFSPADKEVIDLYSKNQDETGECIRSTVEFFTHLDDVEDVLATIAGGDLTSEFNMLSEDDTIGKSIRTMSDNLTQMFSEINAASSQVNIGAGQVASGSQSLAQGSTEQASSVEELSASINEIADKTKLNAGMAQEASSMSNDIKVNAEKGNQQMSHLMKAVTEINEASQSISKVIKVIDDIAFQTNILALNAAVEAARAGAAGKGFAVVAEEVRNLASKSAEAAKDTGGMIENSIEKANLGLTIATETSASLQEIVDGINRNAGIVAEIAQSSNEQALSITQINTGIEQVSQVVQQNSATAEESAAASEEMSGQATLLQELVSRFKISKDQVRQSAMASEFSQQVRTKPQASSESEFSGGGYGKY